MEKIIKPKAEKNYTPGSMSFAAGFSGPPLDVGYFMVADFQLAKSIVENLLTLGYKIDYVEMGLDGDWSCNSMTIYNDTGFHEYDRHGCSMWAEPIMLIHYENHASETYSVWTKEGKNEMLKLN